MARFIGTINDYEKYIGPRIRNIVNILAKNERSKRNGICEFCKKKAELQSAHKHGKGRKTIIHEVIKKYDNGSYIDVDIEKCENEITELHKPINQVFYFLCMECHRKYDSKASEKVTNDYSEINIERNESQQNTLKKAVNFDIENGGQLILLPDPKTFREKLLKFHCAKLTIIYNDGRIKEDIWNAKNITESSNIIGNIRSGYLRDWRQKGIVRATFEVEEIH